ncbi:MAG: glycosyltransferase family 9 protein [Candidatus Omnitrophota bacterium]|nr:glycosyltransferase family 9 protein [Candidatus Omnitrophota bacterium]
MPVVKALKDRYPDCFIGYWCNERVGELLAGNPGINKAFPLSRGDIKRVYKGLKGGAALISLIGQIRRERFDIAFDFSLDSRYGLWSKLAGIKKRVGFDYKGRGRFLTDKVRLAGYSGRHVVEYNLDLLRIIDIDTSSPGLDKADNSRTGRGCAPYSLEVSEENHIKARNILKEYGAAATDLLIGVAPGGGASWGKDAVYKQWPAEKFAEVANKVAKKLNAKVVLLGSAEEKPLAEIVEKMGQTQSAHDRRDGSDPIFPIIDLTGKLSLKELAAVISELKILICNDGGPLHMAAALGVKTVSMFGPVDEKVYGPYPPDAKHIVVKKDLPCRPCYKDFKFTSCLNNRKCLEEITVDEVFEKAKQLI